MTQKKSPPLRRNVDALQQNPERMEQLADLLHRLDSLRDQGRKRLSRGAATPWCLRSPLSSWNATGCSGDAAGEAKARDGYRE
jgi:hypothetical protein